LLMRFQPKLTERLRWFFQLETLHSFPLGHNGAISFVQRGRIGLQRGAFQYGLGADLMQTGKQQWIKTQNWGAWIRHEF
jgi:hypothetical protein